VVRVRRVVSLPNAVLPNAAKELSFLGSALLVADSVVGRGWEIHVDIGAFKFGTQCGEIKPTPELMTGVNGIKVKDGYICFNNTAAGILNRVAINGSDSSRVPGAMVECFGVCLLS
jgi:hypothetical protein